MSDVTALTPDLLQQLADTATEARQNAYAPFSSFQVGAALLTKDGRVFAGVNVENSSYGLTICAERSAACAAVSAGSQEFVAIAIATEGAHGPCGACRQFLNEFGPEMQIVLVDTAGEKPLETIELCELLPRSFRFEKGS